MQKASGMSDTASAIGFCTIPVNCGSRLIDNPMGNGTGCGPATVRKLLTYSQLSGDSLARLTLSHLSSPPLRFILTHGLHLGPDSIPLGDGSWLSQTECAWARRPARLAVNCVCSLAQHRCYRQAVRVSFTNTPKNGSASLPVKFVLRTRPSMGLSES